MNRMNAWEFLSDNAFFVCMVALFSISAIQEGCGKKLATDAYNKCIAETKDAAACGAAKDAR